MKLAVVIPFYQKTRGLLAAAVASIAAQRVDAGVTIDVIILDDGSPVDATSEDMPDCPSHCRVRIIRRSNGGVASARNAALDAVTADTAYVAFLDSDDCWAPDHLRHGIALLERGATFYFDNGFDTDGRDRFARTPFMRDRERYRPEAAPYGRLIDGKAFFAALVTECVPHTSQVIYDFQQLGRCRFDESLRVAGEDHLFWLTLTQSAVHVGYHTGVMGSRGLGVSINRGAFGWDSRENFERVVDEIGLHSRIANGFPLTAVQRDGIERKLATEIDHFFFLAIRNLRRFPVAVMRAIWRLSRYDAGIWRRAPVSILRLRTHRESFRAVSVGATAGRCNGRADS